MKADKIFTIASIATFFALLPALIIMEVRVLRDLPEVSYLFIIADILLVGFIVLETVLLVRKWKKGKEEPPEDQEIEKIEEEWDEKKADESKTKDDG